MHPLLFDKGYHVFPSVVPLELCKSVVRDIEEHTKEGRCGGDEYTGLVEMYHYQSMWDIRQHPRVHACFALLFSMGNLWVTIDRIGRKVPYKNGELWSGFIHWDLNPNIRPRVKEVQGLVALEDTTEEMGGFHCVPSLYKSLDNWINSQPTNKTLYTSLHVDNIGAYAYELALPIPNHVWKEWSRDRPISPQKHWPIEKVAMKAGDLLIWDSYLPHGSGINISDKVRYCQYLSMIPVGDSRTRTERVNCWKFNAPPSGLAFFGDPRKVEQQRASAELTDLGKRLLGLVAWEGSFIEDSYASVAF